MDFAENHHRVVLAGGGAWHEPELIRRGYTAAGLARDRKQFGLIAWQDRYGGWHYPKWQFGADGQVLPEVRSILRLFRSRDALYVMSQFLFPNDEGKTLLALIRKGRGATAIAAAKKVVDEIRAEPKLHRKDAAELERRLRDMRDPVRYVVVSSFSAKWAMVYDVAENVYCHQHIAGGCLIKDRRVAAVIARSLDDKARTPHHHVLPVRRAKGGFCSLEDLPATRYSKRWRPSFRTPKSNLEFVAITESGTRENHVDAMVFAARHRDRILQAIGHSKDRIAARKRLTRTFRIPETLAETILELRLFAMTRKSVAELIDELKQAVRSNDTSTPSASGRD
jgi:hypothetical protein